MNRKTILTAIMATAAILASSGTVEKASLRSIGNSHTQLPGATIGEEALQAKGITPTKPEMRTRAGEEERNLQLFYKEDFSKFTAGSENDIDAEDIAPGYIYGDPFIPAEYTSEPGCWGFGVYQAGGACALNYPELGGVFSTPEGYYGGRIVIKFKAKASMPETPFTVGICSGGIWNPFLATENFGAYLLDPEDGWTDITFEADNNYTTEDCFVQINGSFYHPGLLIDDLEIYRDMDYVWLPSTMESYDFTYDGFTADWGKVATADSYLFSLYREETAGSGPIMGSMDMQLASTSENWIAFDGWTVDLSGSHRTAPGCGMNGADAIPLTANEDMITYPNTSGVYENFSFDIVPTDENAVGEGALILDVMQNGKWKSLAMLPLDYIGASGYSAMFDLTSISGIFTDVRLWVDGLEASITSSPIMISNLSFQTGPARNYIPVVEDMATTENLIHLNSLDPWAEYYFTVKVKAGDYLSEATPLAHAFGLPVPQVGKVSDIDKDERLFIANWEVTPKATAYEANVFWYDEIKESNPSYVLVNDTFSVNEQGTPDAPVKLKNYSDYTLLDGFTETEGWIGFGNIVAAGMLGCETDHDYQGFCLFPPMTVLVSSNPYYSVEMDVWSANDDTLTLIDTSTYDYLQIGVKEGWNKVTATLKGKERSTLGMYMEDGSMFLLDSFRMTQSVDNGDERMWNTKTYTVDASNDTSVLAEAPQMNGGEYFYTVKAIQKYYSSETTSKESDRSYVDFETSSIDEMPHDSIKEIVMIVDASGRKVSADTKGIKIIRYSDGTSEKLLKSK